MRCSPMLLITLLPFAAQASMQGDIGAVSKGTIDIGVRRMPTVRIAGADDMVATQVRTDLDMLWTRDVCVFRFCRELQAL